MTNTTNTYDPGNVMAVCMSVILCTFFLCVTAIIIASMYRPVEAAEVLHEESTPSFVLPDPQAEIILPADFTSRGPTGVMPVPE